MKIQCFTSTLPSGIKQTTKIYELNEGEEIPIHSHAFWHNCLVVKGGVRIYDDVGRSVNVETGRYAEFNAGRIHAIKAIESDTLIVNINEPGHD